MKKIKHLITLCTVLMLIACTLFITSCSTSEVETAFNKLSKAKSYTYVRVQNGEQVTVKVDTKSNIAYFKSNDDTNGEREGWLWYDKEAQKFYSASKSNGGTTVKKKSLSNGEFFTTFATFSNNNSYSIYFDMIDLLDENNGVLSCKTEEEGQTRTVSFSINYEEAIVETAVFQNGTTSISKITFSEIDKTTINIPADIINAQAAA